MKKSTTKKSTGRPAASRTFRIASDLCRTTLSHAAIADRHGVDRSLVSWIGVQLRAASFSVPPRKRGRPKK